MSDEEQHPFSGFLPGSMNVLKLIADGRAIVEVYGNGLGDTAKTGSHLVLKEAHVLVNGGLYLFFNGTFNSYMYRRVRFVDAETVELVSERDSDDTFRIQWPDDEGGWEVLARVDKILKSV
jgi:hypothetical protein